MPVWSIVRLENVKLRVNIVKYIAINPVAAENAAGDALCRSENVILSPADSFETFVR